MAAGSDGCPGTAGQNRPCLRIVIDGIEAGERAATLAQDHDVALEVISVPDGAAHWGVMGFSAMVRTLRQRHPELAIRAILDCGAAAGHVLAALNEADGTLTTLVFTGSAAVLGAMEPLAAAKGVTLARQRPPALWLRPGGNARAAAAAWLTDNR